MLEEPVLVAGGLYAAAHHEPAYGQHVDLRHHGQGHAVGNLDVDVLVSNTHLNVSIG